MKSHIDKYSNISREVIIETDDSGVITFVTPNCSNILKYEQTELINTNIKNYIKYDFSIITVNETFQTGFINKTGHEIYCDMFISRNVIANNKIIGYILSLIYINNYKYNIEINSNFIKLFEHSKDIIYKLQLIPKPKFTYLSPSVENILGYTLDKFLSSPMMTPENIHPDDFEIQLSKSDKNTDFSNLFHVRHKHKNGNYVWLEDYIIPTFNEEGDLIFIEGISRDITKRKQLEKKLENLSYIDGLTGLYNRTYLNKQIKILTCGVEIPVAIIACDLDNLKYFNDTFGHSKGDILLRNVGSLLNGIFIYDSIAIRNGGDEFIIILTNCSKLKAEEIYSKMLMSINEYNIFHEMAITLSSGLSHSSSSKTILNLLSIADKNMYENKYERKNYFLNKI